MDYHVLKCVFLCLKIIPQIGDLPLLFNYQNVVIPTIEQYIKVLNN